MVFEQGVYRLEVDAERTKAFYETETEICCTCAGCRNFAALGDRMPEQVAGFLRQFGLDPMKPVEMSAVAAPDKHSVFYDGWYHICGNILEGTELSEQVGPKQWKIKEAYFLPLDDHGGTALFQEKRDLMSKGFPEPVIQLNVMCVLPWVLDEENPY